MILLFQFVFLFTKRPFFLFSLWPVIDSLFEVLKPYVLIFIFTELQAQQQKREAVKECVLVITSKYRKLWRIIILQTHTTKGESGFDIIIHIIYIRNNALVFVVITMLQMMGPLTFFRLLSIWVTFRKLGTEHFNRLAYRWFVELMAS